jgi:uncharacterized protein (DUF58 family)
MIARLLSDPRIANRIYGFTPPEDGPIVLSHRRVYIVPARLGWMFGVTLVILLIGSINYALSLGFALTFLLAGLGVAGMVHTVRNLGRLRISTGRVEPVFAGESTQFRLYLENDSKFERIAVLARHLGGGAQQVFDVPPASTAEVVLAAPAARRGWLPLGRVMLETRFPVGLFRAWSYVEPSARGLVYPRPEPSPLPPLAADANAGQARAQAAGNDDFSGLRGYQRSDSPRHVAWKAVARAEKMLTKQFHGDAAAQLWLDWALLAPGLGIETRLSRLAGWVLAAESCGALYGLRLPGTELEPARGDAHRAACLEALALFNLDSAGRARA